MNRQLDRRWLAYAVALLVLLLDQLSKAWAEQTLPPGVLRPLLPGLLDLQLVYNRGAAFSLLTQATSFLGLISAAVAVAIVAWLWRQRQLEALSLWAAALLLGRTVGNGLDRWRVGAVVDFLSLVPIRFPVFNLADVSINLAVACIVLQALRSGSRHES
jgi:signal peptidase II